MHEQQIQSGSVGRVLWVEDQPESIADLEDELKGAGLEVKLVDTGDAATADVGRAADEGQPYGIVILDLEYLPRMPTGVDIAKEIWAIRPEQKIAVVSAYLDKHSAELSGLATKGMWHKNELKRCPERRACWCRAIVELCASKADEKFVRVFSEDSETWVEPNPAHHLFRLTTAEQQEHAKSLAMTMDAAWRALLCRDEHSPVTTAFLWGREESIGSSSLGIVHKLPNHFSLRRLIEEGWLALADGLDYAFAVGLDGWVYGLCDIGWGRATGEDFHAPERCLNHCRATSKSDVLSVLVCGTHSRVNVFRGGRLELESLCGEWRIRNPEAFQRKAVEAAYTLGVPENVTKKLCKAAWELSEQQIGALFFLGADDKFVKRCDVTPAPLKESLLRNTTVESLPMGALLAMASRDGAVLVDVGGKIIEFGAFARPRSRTKVSIRKGAGARHTSAAKMTKEMKNAAIVVSQDGRVTLYDKGEETPA